MSLQHAAQHLASHGRGPDTELVHMTKDEVRGLQSLAQAHGGSLTVNPHTGLAEAGFLQSILPAVIGGATAVFAPWALPYVAGGMGLMAWDQSGSLAKGLTTGLGVYGGGQLAAGLGAGAATSGAATSGAEAAAADAGLTSAAATPAGYTAGASYVPTGASTGMTWGGSNALTQANVTGLAPAGVADVGAQGITSSTLGGTLGSQGVTSADYSALGRGIGSSPALASNVGTSSLSSPATSGLTWKNAAMAGAPLIADALTPKTSALPTVKSDSDMGPRYEFVPGTANPQPKASATGVENTYFPEQSYKRLSNAEAKALYGYADGGMAYGNGDLQGDPNLMQVKTYDPVVRMRTGGLSDLGGYSDGGRLLRGPGDGVSDSIPATIGHKQPARLADGEFVVPARIVSELGNGSTEAGARQLYAMMDRVQKARGKTTGKDKVAKNTRAAKYLPA